MRHAGEVVTRTQILDHVWDFAYDGLSNVVDQYVSYLRKKVDRPFGRADIETVRGVGYRLRIPTSRTCRSGSASRWSSRSRRSCWSSSAEASSCVVPRRARGLARPGLGPRPIALGPGGDRPASDLRAAGRAPPPARCRRAGFRRRARPGRHSRVTGRSRAHRRAAAGSGPFTDARSTPTPSGTGSWRRPSRPDGFGPSRWRTRSSRPTTRSAG